MDNSIAHEGANKGTMKGINKGAIEGAIEGATKGVKEKLADLLSVIVANEGKRVPDYKEITGLPESTLEGYIKRLRNNLTVQAGRSHRRAETKYEAWL
jgi:ATP-dependent DNA helicase RecG